MSIQNNKFHDLCYEIAVAFETTLPAEKPPVYSTDFAFPDLVHNKSQESVIRVYSPAEIENMDDGRQISFVPWIRNEEDSIGHRVSFRLKPLSKKSNIMRNVAFARFGEEEAFCFNPSRSGSSYISLEFMTHNQSFAELYLKVRNNEGLAEYFEISASTNEDGDKVVMSLRVVSETETPVHLQKKEL